MSPENKNGMQFPTYNSNLRANLIRNFQGPYEHS